MGILLHTDRSDTEQRSTKMHPLLAVLGMHLALLFSQHHEFLLTTTADTCSQHFHKQVLSISKKNPKK